jgi:hypothetical protein
VVDVFLVVEVPLHIMLQLLHGITVQNESLLGHIHDILKGSLGVAPSGTIEQNLLGRTFDKDYPSTLHLLSLFFIFLYEHLGSFFEAILLSET